MKINKLTVAVAALVLGTMLASAQTLTTPYSKIGYGILSDNASSIQRSMGGVGYAMQNGRTINAMNPASYSQVDSLTFLWDVGVDLTNLWSKENGKSGYSFGGGLDYITSQFRITKNLGGSFGVVPYSSVGYSFGSKLDNNATETHYGSGGISQLYLGFGYQPFKGLSLGANVSYLFGSTTNQTLLNKSNTSYFSREMEVRDWNLQVGVQYAINVSPSDRVVLGITYQPKKSFHGHTWGVVYDSQDTKQDTVGYTSLKGKYEQPHSIGVGVSFEHAHRYLAEVDFTYQDWSKAKYTPLEGFEVATLKFDKRWKAAAGFQYSPNRRGSYFGAMAFRVGGFYNHDYINITGNNVRDYGASMGVSFPVPNGKTTVNLGLEWRHRYSTPNNMIKEDYLNITLGVNFNELWLWKNRIR